MWVELCTGGRLVWKALGQKEGGTWLGEVGGGKEERLTRVLGAN